MRTMRVDAEVVSPAERPLADSSFRRRTRPLLIALTFVALAAIAVVAVLRLPSQPKITAYEQLTLTRDWFSPYVSPLPLVSDGVSIYFNEWEHGDLHSAHKVSVNGGESVRLHVPFHDDYIAVIDGITPDKRELMISRAPKDDFQSETFWLWREGATPHRLGELGGSFASWSFDRQWLTYGDDAGLFIAHEDGTQPRKILSLAPNQKVHWPRFSPDGSRIRFTMPAPGSQKWGLWEVGVDGSGLHPFLEGWNTPSNECCGSWTPDGKTFVFEATHDGVAQIWALREAASLFDRSPPTPIRLTEGPMNMTRPLVSDDGKHIYAVGVQLRADVMRYDSTTREFVADEVKGRSAEWVSYSRDAEWISYITYPQADLWRSRRDGSQALQLTYPPAQTIGSAWSPDNKTIAFSAQTPGRFGIYLIAADGHGATRALTEDPGPEWSPSWSPDGLSLAFCTRKGIQIYDVQSQKVAPLEGGEQMRYPSWSPSGRYLATTTFDGRIPVFDFTTRQWDVVQRVDDVLYPRWSADEQFLYVTTRNFHVSLQRVRLSDRTVSEVASADDEKWVVGAAEIWTGVTPEGDLLYLRDTGVSYIYALDFES